MMTMWEGLIFPPVFELPSSPIISVVLFLSYEFPSNLGLVGAMNEKQDGVMFPLEAGRNL